ncbi:unnamed protein product [Protopolystoma xenopodis]|uniref:Uncharacterized protein n=1 Tax=Protopolystoma xenopodis TaxID=117903 RepID=A0A3S5B4Y0_9PLAT|nr:unnamed protein product [Protopolystoma xenopodis]
MRPVPDTYTKCTRRSVRRASETARESLPISEAGVIIEFHAITPSETGRPTDYYGNRSSSRPHSLLRLPFASPFSRSTASPPPRDLSPRRVWPNWTQSDGQTWRPREPRAED